MEGPPEQVQADEGVRCLVGGSGSHPVKAGRQGQGVLGWPSCPQGSSRALLVDVTVSQAQGCAHSGLCPI